jgi:hypothetical protein
MAVTAVAHRLCRIVFAMLRPNRVRRTKPRAAFDRPISMVK